MESTSRVASSVTGVYSSPGLNVTDTSYLPTGKSTGTDAVPFSSVVTLYSSSLITKVKVSLLIGVPLIVANVAYTLELLLYNTCSSSILMNAS